MPIVHQNFSLLIGEAKQVRIQVLNELGQPTDLTNASNISWKLSDSPDLTNTKLFLDIANNGNIHKEDQVVHPGLFSFILFSEQTASLAPGVYFYQATVTENALTYIVASGAVFVAVSYETPDTLYDGDIVEVFHIINGNKLLLMLEGELEDNREYRVVLTNNLRGFNGNLLVEPYTFTFTSRYSPMFTSFESIGQDILQYLPLANKDNIYRNIRENSMAIKTITKRTDIDWTNPPVEFAQYVRHKTIYDLVVGAYIKGVGSSGKSVKLGDLTVDNKDAGVNYEELLNKLATNLQPWYDMCLGFTGRGRASAQSVIKSDNRGYEGTYPFSRDIRI